MASTNKKNKAALNSIKMQAASEVGVPLKDNGYKAGRFNRRSDGKKDDRILRNVKQAVT